MRLIINRKHGIDGYEHLENKHEKHYTHKQEEHHEEDEHQSVGICKKSRYWEDAAYHDYVRKHGEHFSRSLSVWVCSMMENRNGKTHNWSPEQVDMAISGVGKTLKPAHKYDVHYLANMAYADYILPAMGSGFLGRPRWICREGVQSLDSRCHEEVLGSRLASIHLGEETRKGLFSHNLLKNKRI